MRKKLLLLGAMSLSIGVFAQQQPPNGGFENWTSSGNSDQEPTEWNSMMTGDFSCTFCGSGQVQTIWEENTIVHSGNKAVKLETQEITVFFVTARVNGTVTLGEIGTTGASAPEGYTRTIQSDNTFSEELTGQPDSVVFWANYTPNSAQPDHFASCAAVLHTTDPSGSFWNPTSHGNYDPTSLNGDATALFLGTSGWERKAQAFDYSTGAQTGNNYLLLTFASTDVAGADGDREGDLLYIDDVMLIYNVRTNYSFSTACAGATVSVPFEARTLATGSRIFTAELSDASGSFASPVNIGTYTVNNNDTCVNTISATIPGGTAAGAGYKIRVVGNDASFSTIAGSAFTVNAAPTAGTLTSSDVTNCLTPNGGVTLAGSTGTSFELFDSGNNSQGTNATGNFTALSAGDYYVVATASGCDATTNTVTVGNAATAPAAPVAGTDADYCDGQTPTDLVATAGAGGTLQWYLGGNAESTGTTQTPLATVGTHVYTVTETVAGCESAPTTVTVTVNANPTMSGEVAGDVTNCTTDNGTVDVTSDGTSFELFDSGNNSQGTNASGSFTGLSAADYYVVATLGTCTSTSSTVTVGTSTTYTVTAAPGATQAINIGVDGTMITATESDVATSREWKFTTTSGSGYMSFATAETGLTYTPNFAAVGTYYVICESIINGCTEMSAEIQIDVTDPNASIDENGVDNFNVYAFENEIYIDLSNITLNNPILKLVSTDGKVVLESRLNNGSLNTISVNVPMGVYVYNVVTNDNITTGKVVLK